MRKAFSTEQPVKHQKQNMITTTIEPTLESLGLKCTIVRNGVGRMNDEDKDQTPMLKWSVLFTNVNGPGEAFDYYTGIGCGPEMSESQLRSYFPLVANVPKHSRWNIADKHLLARIASQAAFKAKWTPDPIEILNCLSRDGDACESTFEDWCSELGYDTDSRRAEKIYRACQDNFMRLKKILSTEHISTVKALEL